MGRKRRKGEKRELTKIRMKGEEIREEVKEKRGRKVKVKKWVEGNLRRRRKRQLR